MMHDMSRFKSTHYKAGDSKPDQVNHPPHYQRDGIECIQAIEAALTPEEFRGYCKGNVMAKSINFEVEKCDNESNRMNESQKPGFNRMPCCEVETSFFATDAFQAASSPWISVDFIHPIIPSLPQEFYSVCITTPYSTPPDNGPPIYLRIERFLI